MCNITEITTPVAFRCWLPWDFFLLIQDNAEEKASGPLSARSAYYSRFAGMLAHGGDAVSSARTLQCLRVRLDIIKKELKAERRKLERARQMPAQVRTAAQILYCLYEDEEQLKVFFFGRRRRLWLSKWIGLNLLWHGKN